MLVKILGIIDLLAGTILIFNEWLNLSKIVFLIFGIILFAKSFLGFPKNFASWIDIFCGILLLLSIFFSFPIWIRAIFGLLVFQKGVFSFL
jgi:hypothetical protein